MKNKLLNTLSAVILFLMPNVNFGQAPTLGTAANFALFTTNGLVKNTGTTYLTHVTGNCGSNLGPVTGFGNVDGIMAHTSDPISVQGATDLLAAYGQLNATTPTDNTLSPLLGTGPGQILNSGVYSITSPSITLNQNLILDAQGDPSKVFIFQLQGAFSTSAGSKVKLVNGALACNVFWKIEGLVDMATNTSMKGTIIANNSAINLAVGDTLEGRALSINGAINVTGVLVYTPSGCGSPILTGPAAPALNSAACYAVFSGNGALSNTPISSSIGDVGNNGGGSITGWSAGDVTGALHLTQDPSTIACSVDLSTAYNTLNALSYDIELLAPAEFGHNLVLTPHTYLINGQTTFTDTVILNAQGNANAVFVIKIIGGGIATSTYSNVKLINGAQSKNVFWMIQAGSVDINNYSVFRGTIVVAVGAINLVNTGIELDGRALTMDGAITTAGLAVIMPPGCGSSPIVITNPINQTVCEGDTARFSVTASGSGLTYIWRKGNVNLINGGNISGADSDSLTIYPAGISDTSSFYNVIVSGNLLPNDTSINVSLIVNALTGLTSFTAGAGVVCQNAPNETYTAAAAHSTSISYSVLPPAAGIINSVTGIMNWDAAFSGTAVITATSTGLCGITSKDTLVTVNPPIGPAVFTSAVPVVCQDDANGNYTASALNSTSIVYSVLPISAGIINSNTGVMNWDASFSGTATITADANSLCGTSSKDTIVTVNPSIGATVFTAASAVVCQDAADQTYTASAANSTSIVYTVLPVTAGVINAATGVMNWDASFNGAVVITATSTGLCGTSSKDTIVTVNPSIGATVFTAASAVVCQDAADQTYTASAANSISISYSVLPVTAGVINAATGVMNWDAAFSGSAVITATSTGLCGTTSKDTTTTVNPTIGATSFTAGAAIVCQNAPDETYTASASNSTSIVYSVLPAAAGVINAFTGVMNWNGLFIGNAAITASSSGLCGSTSADFAVTVNPIPAVAPSTNSPVCTGTSLSLNAQTVIGATYSWTCPNGYTSTAQDTVIFSASLTDSGTYSLIVTLNGCVSGTASQTVVVKDCIADLSVVKSVSDMHPFVGHTIVFTISAVNNGPYDAAGVAVNDILQSGYSYISSAVTAGLFDPSTGVWTIGNLSNGASAILTVTAAVNTEGNYVNTAIIYGNQADTLMANNVSSVEPIPTDFFIPEGFSPNGDGTNDLFVIRGILNYPANTFVIFNRWGNKVFETNSYQNTWDGKATIGLRIGGEELPIGTYFYILDLKDSSPIFKGTIYLNR